jgi:hypothetical protein
MAVSMLPLELPARDRTKLVVPALVVVSIAAERRNSSLATRKTQQFPCGRRFLDAIRPKVLDSLESRFRWVDERLVLRQARPSAAGIARPFARLGLQIG